uniref:Uncharacterized protein n=1 Tax=Candidatus Kentrum eta TaxID=2126337 RepID=A0A450UFD3_9GAMM|nr:MAG: Protein of unknown function (DUF2442) [Candidatus Kentron sp. H]VFJ91260.1 MAG: Protein of unknown function (DUF2442) [Candidatus Kentron sp. H]VFJ97808.1 MAG: Protein of unknown function (DUF2442) [Candidatus Kentron sp. H]
MNPRVEDVSPNDDYTIDILFDDGKKKTFDVKPYLDKGIFREFKGSGNVQNRQTGNGQHSMETRPGFLSRYLVFG